MLMTRKPALPAPTIRRRLGGGCVLALVVWASVLALGAPPSGSIRWVEHEGRRVVEVSGLDAESVRLLRKAELDGEGWSRVFRVTATPRGEARDPRARAMLGSYRFEGDRVTFEPRFPLEPEIRYEAEFDLGRLPGSKGVFRLAASMEFSKTTALPPVEVTRIDPAPEVLPANVLRFYLHFSGPMSRGHAYEHVRILDSEGTPLDLPFLELGEELWDPEGRRLTLLVDPGRIKTDLVPNREAGPVLKEGKTYSLVVDSSWLDAQGRPLKGGKRKMFRAGPPDRRSPDPKTWTLSIPASGTRDPLEIDLKEAIDRPQAERLIVIKNADGVVSGSASVENADTLFRFVPDRPWDSGPHRVEVGSVLEDPCGNSIERPFEVDLFEVDSPRKAEQTVTIPFEIKTE